MRFSTILSLLIALLLAGAAVIGTRTYLSSERQDLLASFQQQAAEQAAAAAAAAAEAAAKAEQEPKETIVVAAEPLKQGELITASNVQEIEWTSPILPEGSYRTIEELVLGEAADVARYALVDVVYGDPVLTSKVTEPGQRAKLSTVLSPGMKAVSIRVNDVNGVAGFIFPGDRVDVLLTINAFTEVLLQGVKVVAKDQMANEQLDNPTVVRTITFEVSTIEAQKLVLAGNLGTLSLALRSVARTGFEKNERVTIADLFEQDVADELLAAVSGDVEAVAALEGSRLEDLEKMMQELSSNMSQKLDSVEGKLQQEPVIQEVIVEKIVQAPPVVPISSTVTVIRNGSRNEYKVDTTEEEEEGEETSSEEQIEVQVSQ